MGHQPPHLWRLPLRLMLLAPEMLLRRWQWLALSLQGGDSGVDAPEEAPRVHNHGEVQAAARPREVDACAFGKNGTRAAVGCEAGGRKEGSEQGVTLLIKDIDVKYFSSTS